MPRHLPDGARFALVGASGYVVNLATFSALLAAGSGHRLAAVAAFLVSAWTNYRLNGRFTFRRRGSAARFLGVAVAGFGLSLAILDAAVAAGVPAVLAQAGAVVAAMPVTYLGHRSISFAVPSWTAHGPAGR